MIPAFAVSDGPWAYYSRYVEGGEYPIMSRMQRSDFESGLWTPDGPPTPRYDLAELVPLIRDCPVIPSMQSVGCEF